MAPEATTMNFNAKLTPALIIALFAGCSGGEETSTPPGPSAGTSAGGAAAGGSGSGTSGSVSAGASAAGSSGASAGTTSGGGQGGTSGSAAAGTAGASAGTGGGSAGSAGATATDGATLFATNCAACHGAQGVGGPLGPELQHPVRDYSAWVTRHGRAMTTFPAPMLPVAADKLSDANLNAIWDYLDEPPQPTTGQALFLDYCANCHGADGKGGPTGRNILNELGELKMLVRQGAHAGEFDMRREYMPAFPTTRITDAELNLIYSYVDSL